MYKHDKEFGNTERAHFKSADLLLRSNKTTNGVKHLADAFMYVGKRRNRTEADEVFQSFKSKYKDQIPWPSAVQRHHRGHSCCRKMHLVQTPHVFFRIPSIPAATCHT